MDISIKNCRNGIMLTVPGDGDYVFNRSADVASFFAANFPLDGNLLPSFVDIVLFRGVTPENWIRTIKAVRNYTGKGLKESKELVDAVKDGSVSILAKGVRKEEAEKVKKEFAEYTDAVITFLPCDK